MGSAVQRTFVFIPRTATQDTLIKAPVAALKNHFVVRRKRSTQGKWFHKYWDTYPRTDDRIPNLVWTMNVFTVWTVLKMIDYSLAYVQGNCILVV